MSRLMTKTGGKKSCETVPLRGLLVKMIEIWLVIIMWYPCLHILEYIWRQKYVFAPWIKVFHGSILTIIANLATYNIPGRFTNDILTSPFITINSLYSPVNFITNSVNDLNTLTYISTLYSKLRIRSGSGRLEF